MLLSVWVWPLFFNKNHMGLEVEEVDEEEDDVGNKNHL
jgi:hypothetical protein